MSKLARKTYLRLRYAGLQEDMSQRIMFSILPHLSDSSQVALTGGVVDSTALKAAVEGRKNLIKYGMEAVLMELSHYEAAGEDPWQRALDLTRGGDREQALDVAVTAFQNLDAWATRYGGRAWEMIAKTLRQIVRLDKQLNIIRQKPRSADNQEKEIQVMKDLIVEMNVFDGLAHNSDNILANLVDIENRIVNKDKEELSSEYKERYRQIKRLMDAKELDSPVEVYKRIQDTLMDSGDVNKFKEWVSKLRRSEEFFKTDPKLVEKLFMIYLRKAVMSGRKELNDIRDNISKELDDVIKFGSDLGQLIGELDIAASEVRIIVQEFDEHKNHFAQQYPELSTQEVTNMIVGKFLPTANKVSDKLTQLVNSLTSLDLDSERYEQESRTKTLGTCKESLSLLNRFSYLLDSI
jgi:hypothetical protein